MTIRGTAIAIAVIASGCSVSDEPPRAAAFHEAAQAHQVPEDWLLALGYAQSRLERPDAVLADDPDDPGTDGVLADDTAVDEADGLASDAAPAGDDGAPPTAWGLMQLTDDQVARAATLTGHDPDAIRTDLAANVDAAAALLAAATDLRAGTADFLGVAGDDDATQLALADLDDTIAGGFDVTTADGEHVVLPAADPEAVRLAPVAPGKYPERQFIASPNFSSRLGYSIRYIVVHDIEGTAKSAISIFRHASSEVSAHYVVRARDGHVVQMVHEGDNAWHAGHGWFNRHSIGIEHEGFANKKRGGGFYTETQYRASAALSCAIAVRHGIPVDRKHIFGHENVPSNLASHTLCSDRAGDAGRCGGVSHHTDPGRYWKWNHYVRLVKDCVQAAR